MKTYEQIVSKFSNEPGLVYRYMFVYPNNSIYRGQMKKKDEQMKKKDEQITELIKKAGIQNSNITQNIQQNIKLVAYKETDMSHLTEQDYLYCLNRSNMCIPNLIKKIHFNPKKPENHNVFISNLKSGYIMLYLSIIHI